LSETAMPVETFARSPIVPMAFFIHITIRQKK
jgi:hypothetical protein